MIKNILVVGMARSGLSVAKLLVHHGHQVTLNDSKTYEDLKDTLTGLESTNFDFGGAPKDVSKYDLMVLSPGVPTDLSFIKEARLSGVQILGALEVAFQYAKGRFFAITGTNGKTTTTTLTYEIFKTAGRDAYAVGNIGNPLADHVMDSHDQRDFITEVSSFQLESIDQFHVHVSAILNLTPDHLNRHKTMKAYEDAKKRIFENQTKEDYLLLNYDNEPTRHMGESIDHTQVLYFSKMPLKQGVYVENGWIKVNLDKTTDIMPVEEIQVPGPHNLENVLAAVGIAFIAGIDIPSIRKAVHQFQGVEHRVEYVGEFNGMKCYNDSKATNPESSIVALKSMQSNTILIAGGMDKGSEFESFVNAFEDKIKHLILLGETKEIIAQVAKAKGLQEITYVKNMEEAVGKAFEIGQAGDALLLSPACASWDMYPSYEVRGEHFKTCIKNQSK